jgi:hypothetical protein
VNTLYFRNLTAGELASHNPQGGPSLDIACHLQVEYYFDEGRAGYEEAGQALVVPASATSNQYNSSKGGPFFLSPATGVDAKETVACETCVSTGEVPGT